MRCCRWVALCLLLLTFVYPMPSDGAANPQTLILEEGDSRILSPGVIDKVAVGDPKIADIRILSKKEALVVAKSSGGTTLYIWSGKSAIPYQLSVHPRGMKALAEDVTKAIAMEGITAHSVGSTLVITGEALSMEHRDRALATAKRFGREVVDLTTIKADPPQVQIKVKMVEATKDAIKELGVDWKDGDSAGGFANIARAVTVANPTEQLLNRVKLWVDEGRAKLLAEPNLVTVSGTSASFLAGGEIPVPVIIDGQTSIQWKTYGVSLAVTPRLEADGTLIVKVRPEVSTLDWSSATGASSNLPAMRKRWADTELKVTPGSSIVIAGLMQNEETKVVSSLPVLGSLPIIGELFRSTRYVNRETELLVVVTPTIYAGGKGDA